MDEDLQRCWTMAFKTKLAGYLGNSSVLLDRCMLTVMDPGLKDLAFMEAIWDRNRNLWRDTELKQFL